MSSFRNHRIVIASLFLPQTAALGDPSEPPTPVRPPNHRLLSGPATPRPKSPLHANFGGPLRSIVDDLADKSRVSTPSAAMTHAKGSFFPGISMVQTPLHAAVSAIVESQAPPMSRKQHTTHTDHQYSPHRVSRRKSSRSSSRKPTLDFGRAWHIEGNPHCNGGLRNAVGSVSDRMKKKLWVGVLGVSTDGFDEELRASINKKMRLESECLPVWVPDEEFTKCYDEFCHQVLWPCLHYAVPDAPKTKSFYESASWAQYVAINQKFADTIVANYEDGDIIWVNDYHLMLVPSLVRAKLPSAPIGFFLHVAFPSSEIFRCLSVRQQLLRGMLAADLIGFQTANFARHFRQTVSRILSLEALPKGIQTNERFVDVAVFPMGIDVNNLTQKRRETEVLEWVKLLKQRYAGMKMIVGRDKLDEVQGVRHKIAAFEMFLEKYPEFQGKVVLIQVALTTTESGEYQEKSGVIDQIARINSRFSTLTYQPVVFLHTDDLTFSQYLALLTVADAFLVTSIREGMALRTHEFVECQDETHKPLILSEFTGSYSYSGFRSCLPINPWDKRMVADAINQALTMSPEEMRSRWQDLHNHVIAQNAQAFVTSFLTRCLRVHLEHQNQVDLDFSVAQLDLARVLPKYKHSHKRLLLVDFEGTLWKRDPRSKEFNPPADAIEALNALARDRANDVWLLSGLPIHGALDNLTGEENLFGIIAENGCFIRPPPNGRPQEWISMLGNFDRSWKAPCLEILQYFTERTPNSFVEEREASIVWRFWTGPPEEKSADRQWARRQAAEAQNHIFDSLGERHGLRIIPGLTSFLVLPNNISRSTAVGSILSPGGLARSPITPRRAFFAQDEHDLETDVDLVLAISSDEKLLRRLNEIDGAETVSTSERGTDAKWKLEAAGALAVLQEIVRSASGVRVGPQVVGA